MQRNHWPDVRTLEPFQRQSFQPGATWPNSTTSSRNTNNREEDRKAAKWVRPLQWSKRARNGVDQEDEGGLRDLVKLRTECEVRLGGIVKRVCGRCLERVSTVRGPLGKDRLLQ